MIVVDIDSPKSCAECPMNCRTSNNVVLCRNDMRKHTVMDEGCLIIGEVSNDSMSDLQKGDDLTEKESETGCTDKKCPFYLNPDYTRCKECEEMKKAGIMTPVEIARLVAGDLEDENKCGDTEK